MDWRRSSYCVCALPHIFGLALSNVRREARYREQLELADWESNQPALND